MKTSREPLWTSEQTAEYLGIPRRTLDQWSHRGTGPRSYRVGKHRRYRPDEVESWLDGRASNAAGDAAF